MDFFTLSLCHILEYRDEVMLITAVDYHVLLMLLWTFMLVFTYYRKRKPRPFPIWTSRLLLYTLYFSFTLPPP